MWLILTKSPKSLGAYKYLMVYTVLFEISYSVIDALLTPVIYSHQSVYMIFTVLKKLWIPVKWAKICLTVYCGMFGQSMAMFALQFFYRYLIFIRSKLLKSFKNWKIFLWMLIPVTTGVVWGTTAIMLCDPDAQTDDFMKIPVLLTFDLKVEDIVYLGPHFFKLGDDGNQHIDNNSVISLIILFFIVMTSFISIIYFGAKCYFKLRDLVMLTTSQQLLDIQAQLFHALLMQSLIPLVLMHIPTTVLFLFTLFEIDMGAMNNFAAVTIALFPAIDPLPTMFIVKDYRNAIKAMVLQFFTNPPEDTEDTEMQTTAREIKINVLNV